MKITLICRGDNNWEKEFEDKYKARDFLWTLVGKVYGYYKAKKEAEHLFCFDIEDDCITWIEGDKKMYCAGWHWGEEQNKEPIMMDGEISLYGLFRELEH